MTSEAATAREAAGAAKLKPTASTRVRMLDQPATMLAMRSSLSDKALKPRCEKRIRSGPCLNPNQTGRKVSMVAG